MEENIAQREILTAEIGIAQSHMDDDRYYTKEEVDQMISLTKNVLTNLEVGAIPEGTTLKEGTLFPQFVEQLVVEEQPPTVNFSISKSGNVSYGDVYRERLTVSVSNMGTSKNITGIEWYANNVLVHTDEIEDDTPKTWSYEMTENTVDNTTFKAVVSYIRSDDNEATVTKEASIHFYYPRYYGSINTLEPTEEIIKALTYGICTARSFTQTFSMVNSRIATAYPKSFGNLTSIKDGNGFDITDSFTKVEMTIIQNETPIDYLIYILTEPATVTNYTVKFS